MVASKISLALGSIVLLLAACSERDPILQGERLGLRTVLERDQLFEDAQASANQSLPVALPAAVANTAWAQSGVSPHVRVDHAALGTTLTPIWDVSIGAGDGRRHRLNVDPVGAEGRIFTIDSNHTLTATSTAGALLWSTSLVPERDRADQAQGGGLALGNGALFVTSGFGRLMAVDPATGAELWTQRLGATATGAPSYRDGLVYVTAGDQTGWAVEAETGRVRWQTEGLEDLDNVAGAPAPAIGDKRVVMAFGNGTLQGLFREGGFRVWSADLFGARIGETRVAIDDITGDPLIAENVVYAGTHSGRVVALSVADGDRIWTASFGALGPLWPLGDSVAFVSDTNRLVRLSRETGDLIWAVDLHSFPPNRNPSRRRDSAYAQHGPILAGGHLIVAGSDGALRAFDPGDGALAFSVDIPGGATTRPIVMGGTLYVVSARGRLHAFR